jgi:predicted short-subunit dehydrogenase-like oxidoreductase (DUF2520 family)
MDNPGGVLIDNFHPPLDTESLYPMMDPTRLGVGVVGAGRVGPVIATALAGAGHALVGMTRPSDGDTERVSSVVPGIQFFDAEELVERCELVILAVPDDALPDLVKGLALGGRWQSGQIVLHTSIRHGLGVLAPATSVGAIPVTLHPLMEFTGTSMDLARMKGAWAVVSAPAVATPIAEALAVEMGMEPLVVSDRDRDAIASASALATSFAATTIREAADRLRTAGIDNPGMVLGPLVRSSVDNALRDVAGNDVELGNP